MKKYLFIILLVGVWSCENEDEEEESIFEALTIFKGPFDDEIAILECCCGWRIMHRNDLGDRTFLGRVYGSFTLRSLPKRICRSFSGDGKKHEILVVLIFL